MTTIAVISDTHMPRGSRELPLACIERLASADLILHGGDFTAPSVLEDLRAYGKPVAGVYGNMDSAELRRMLPEQHVVEVDGRRIGMVHDAGPAQGRLNRMRLEFHDCDAVVYGHSHIPLHEELDGFQIFNPGSPTDRRRQPRHSMGMAHVENGRIRFELVWLD
jgi:putative phosphoesterase